MTSGVDGADRLQSESVPKSDVLVSCAASSRQKTSVQGAPINGFDSGLMLGKLGEWLIVETMADVPNHQLVVVAAGGEHFFIVGAPS